MASRVLSPHRFLDRLIEASLRRQLVRVAILSTFAMRLGGEPTPSLNVEELLGLTYAIHGSQALQINLYRPASVLGHLPAILYLPGGNGSERDRDASAQMARALAKNGYIVAVTSQRQAGAQSFASALHDARAAVRWLRSNAKQHGIDPKAIAAVGHSGGGQLAAVLATSGDDRRLEAPDILEGVSTRIQAAVVSSAPFDFHSPPRSETTVNAETRSLKNTLSGGTAPALSEHAQKMSPLYYLDNNDPPIAFITGETDDPSTRAETFRRRMIKIGVPTRLTVIKNEGHDLLNNPATFGALLENTLLFLDWHLRRSGQLPVFNATSTPLHTLFPSNAVWTSLGGGYAGCEGAQWITGEEGPTLLFAAHHDFLVFRWSEKSGLKVWRQDSPEATAFRPDGSGGFYVVEQLHRTVAHWDNTGQLTSVLAERFEGKRLNRPNDLIVHPDGTLWFTDPDYLFRQRPDDIKELDGQFIYRLDPRSGELKAVIRDLKLPNGLTFSPEFDALYFNDSSGDSIFRASLALDGTLGPRETFAQIAAKGLDGLAFDPAGRLWCTALDGVHVFDRAGVELGVLNLPFKPTSIAFYSAEGATPRVCVTTREAAFITTLLP